MDGYNIKTLKTDLLIIGGGTAGCFAAVRAKEKEPDLDVLIMEKAHIERSGCLAAGMNAINAYLNPGETPESFLRYVRADSMGLVREDLVLSIAERLNEVVRKVEGWGLPIKKNKDGHYTARGRWNIKINGERLKPIIAAKAVESGVKVLNRTIISNLLVTDGRVRGVFGLNIRKGVLYFVQAGAVIVATGGAAGIYRPNNGGKAHHKMWYSPFNTGAGYAVGIRAGAEMTSFEMRFIALRTKDVIAPTGTLALGFGALQVNAEGERFMKNKYSHLGSEGAPTPLRVYGPTREIKEGRGPVFMDTTNLNDEEVRELKKSYLNMYPELILSWAANAFNPGKEPVEIQGTEPYLVGGHTQAGYWINAKRETTIKGLYAAGDVAGGAPYKFVSGCWAEGAIAAENAVEYIKENDSTNYSVESINLEGEYSRVFAPIMCKDGIGPEEMEECLQKIMDEYAGGISRYYEMSDNELKIAEKKIRQLKSQVKYLKAVDFHDLMNCHEVIDRIDIAEVLIQHLLYRKETRWPVYQSRVDYSELNDRDWLKFVNSVYRDNEIKIIERPYRQIVSGDRYLP